MNALHPPLEGAFSLTVLRERAATPRGRLQMQNTLTEYRQRRSLLSRHKQTVCDIAAARFRHALDEQANTSPAPLYPNRSAA